MDTFVQDLKYGLRTLMKNPGFAIIAIFGLSFGIAVNTAIFTVVNAVLIQPLPYADPGHIYMLWEKQSYMEPSVAYPNFMDWRSENHVFESMAAFRKTNMNLTGRGDPERLSIRMVSADFFTLLGVHPAIGRDFRAGEDQPGGEPVALLSNGLWQRRFGSSPAILGASINLDGLPYTVIGVAPSHFEFASGADVFVPIGRFYNPEQWGRGSHPGIYVLGRLKKDVSVKQMDSDLQTIAASLAKQYPETNVGSGVVTKSLRDDVVGDIRPSLLLLTAAVALVLLIACANVANLMLARTAERTREIAIRVSLGAGRKRIVRQVLTESLVLSTISSAIGIVLAYWGVDLLLALRPDALPKLHEISLNLQALAFTIGLTVVSAFLLGVLPAFKSASPDLNEVLKDGSSKQSGGRAQGRIREALVGSEVAIALMLLIATGLLTRSFIFTQSVDPGFRTENILTVHLSLPAEKYKGVSSIAFFDQLQERLLALPGVKSAGYSNGLPFAGAAEVAVFVEGRTNPPAGQAPESVLYVANPDYFETMGIRLHKGRFFTAHDDASSPVVTIVDETLAQQFFPGQDPIGKRISMGDGAPFMQIVGVVGHVQHYGLDSAGPAQCQMYFPMRQVPEQLLPEVMGDMSVVVWTTGDPLNLAPLVRKTVLSIDPAQPVFQVQPMDQWLSSSLSSRKFAMTLISIFAGMALLLALIGLYGVMSYTVVQRTREIGIRVALGAARSDILTMIVVQGLLPVAIGLVIGLAGAYAFSQVLAGLLFEITPRDPITFAAIPLFLFIVALLASYIPTRRALNVDPVSALRYE